LTALSILGIAAFAVGQSWTAAPPQPGPRTPATQAYDASRNRTVMFGGLVNGVTPTAETWEHDGSHWIRVATASSPLAEPLARMTYDFARNRIVEFGVLGETWEYDGTNWTRRLPATSPPGRERHGMTYDLQRARTVMFGGVVNGTTSLSDTWEFDGSTWQARVTATTPLAGFEPLSYDIVRGYTVMLSQDGRTWLWDGLDWRLCPTTHRPRLVGHNQFYDLVRQRTVVTGGQDVDNGFLANNYAWEFDGVDWTRVALVGGPLDLLRTTISCNLSGRALMFGGGGWHADIHCQTWELSSGIWLQRDAAPPPRALFGMTHDTRRDRVVLFGGVFTGLGETWERAGSAWRRVVTANTPPLRFGNCLAFDAMRGRTVMFDGRIGNTQLPSYFGDTWEYDGVDWTLAPPGATAPPARANHAMAYDLARRVIVLFGGAAPNGPLADTWLFDGTRWQLVTTQSSPAARSYHALAYDARRQCMVLYGGNDLTRTRSDTWEFDGQTWTARTNVGAAGPLAGHAMTFDAVAGRVLLFGYQNVGVVTNCWQYDGVAWTLLLLATRPPGSSSYGLVSDTKGRIVYHDGSTGGTWEFDPPRVATWSALGAGCADSCGVPALDAPSAAGPALGAQFTVRVTSQCAQPAAGVLAFGFDLAQWNGTALPVELAPIGMPGCNLWIAPDSGWLFPLAFQGSVATFTVQVPANPQLVGLVAGAQAVTLDPTGTGALTNAVVMRVF
jgi:hypothetical protein